MWYVQYGYFLSFSVLVKTNSGPGDMCVGVETVESLDCEFPNPACCEENMS